MRKLFPSGLKNYLLPTCTFKMNGHMKKNYYRKTKKKSFRKNKTSHILRSIFIHPDDIPFEIKTYQKYLLFLEKNVKNIVA